MEIEELRRRFLTHFQQLGYQKLNSSSIVPENDPSVLFTTAGMQQFKDYYLHPEQSPSAKIITVQPVIRTSDIDEIGDETHFTMFEMLGNFSFGHDSSMKMKQMAAKEYWDFFTKVVKLPEDELTVDVFAGDSELKADNESEGVWLSLGVEVRKTGRDDTFWGPTGLEGPCGPSAEIYIKGIEVGTLVFNQYFKSPSGQFDSLEKSGLDVGLGIERLATVLQNKESVWQIKPFSEWLKTVPLEKETDRRKFVDFLKTIVFLISAGIKPANKGREYILRRLIRQCVFLAREKEFLILQLIKSIRNYYLEAGYRLLPEGEIIEIYNAEKSQFEKNLARAVNHLNRWLTSNEEKTTENVTKLAFQLFESYGFPRELVISHLIDQGLKIDSDHFAKMFATHQEISRQGVEKQFRGGLADHDEQTIKHHTAHHLLLAALRKVLGPNVFQRGSNVNSERLRLDFSFDRKLTDDERQKVEELVNQKITEDLSVKKEVMKKDVALSSGALAEFGQKYGDEVTVYSINNFSKELCGGPHVERTGVLGHFKILKEEASSQGIRRIKAKVESA